MGVVHVVVEETQLTGPDLADPRTFAESDHQELWAGLRAARPVYWNEPRGTMPGFWALSRYDDVLAIYKDNVRFTSEQGNVLATLLQGGDSASGKMLAVTDGPRHRAIRTLMMKSLSPRVLGRVGAAIHQRTEDLVRSVVGRGPCDFAADVADHIPINTIGDLMDVPREDRAKLVEWNNKTLARYSDDHGELEEWLARNEILLYFSALAKDRRSAPGEDILSSLVTGEVEGAPLTEDEIIFNCYSLIVGGDESSRMSSIGAVLALYEHPEQWQALRDGTVDLDTATEEVLRWTTPAMHFGRRAVQNVVLRGELIKAGDVVTLWNSAANFDPEVFASPGTFDLARTPNKHIAFGSGPHFCLGAHLGRAHVRAMLECLREQVGEIRVTDEPQRLYSNFVNGYTSLPVELVGS